MNSYAQQEPGAFPPRENISQRDTWCKRVMPSRDCEDSSIVEDFDRRLHPLETESYDDEHQSNSSQGPMR